MGDRRKIYFENDFILEPQTILFGEEDKVAGHKKPIGWMKVDQDNYRPIKRFYIFGLTSAVHSDTSGRWIYNNPYKLTLDRTIRVKDYPDDPKDINQLYPYILQHFWDTYPEEIVTKDVDTFKSMSLMKYRYFEVHNDDTKDSEPHTYYTNLGVIHYNFMGEDNEIFFATRYVAYYDSTELMLGTWWDPIIDRREIDE